MFDYGFVGTGNMGKALALSLSNEQLRLCVSNRTNSKAENLASSINAEVLDNLGVAKDSNVIILGVKPQILPSVLEEIKGALIENSKKYGKKPTLVTMAAGVKMDTVCSLLNSEYPVIRIMPNTPVAICKGVILVGKNKYVTEAEYNTFKRDFAAAGLLVDISEDKIDAASVISGCGPAYIYMYIDALAKAGENLGLDYDTAVKLSCSTAEGAARLAIESSESLEDLRKAVCSPGGSTIEGVKSLLDSNLDETVSKALESAYNRTKELAGER